MSKHKSKFAKNRARTRKNKGYGLPVGTKSKVPYWATHAAKATEDASMFLEASGLGPYNAPVDWGEAPTTSSLESIENLARLSHDHGIPIECPGAWGGRTIKNEEA